MSDELRISIHITPIEELADENSETHDVLASEVGKSLGSQNSVDLTNYAQTAAIQGYLNKTVEYLECIDSADTTDISSLAIAKVVFIKNTGFTYSSATELGAALDRYVKVMIGTTAIAYLEPGASIVLQDPNGGLDCTTIHVRTVLTNGSPDSGAGHLAVEKLVVR